MEKITTIALAVCSAVLLWFIACAKNTHKPHAVPEEQAGIVVLQERYDAKLIELTNHLAEDAPWISVMDCDAMLWNGMAKALGGIQIDLSLAIDEEGDAHRRPVPCYTRKDGDQGSKSSFSNDMAIGYLWGLWRSRDQAALEKWAARLEKRKFVMGEPWPEEAGRLLLSINNQGILGRSLYAISGGKVDKIYRRIFKSYASVEADYERHIQALGIVLQGEIDEALRVGSLDATRVDSKEEPVALVDINDDMFDRLRALVEEEPDNPLFEAALSVYTGDYERSISLLNDDATPVPSYVRGHDAEAFSLIEWLFSANLVLRRYPKGAQL